MLKYGSQKQVVLLTLAFLCMLGLIAGVSAQIGAYSDDTPGRALGEVHLITSTSGNSTLRGIVFDSVTGLKVPGANISIAGLSTISDSNGNYTITRIPPGSLDADFTGSPRSGLAPLTVSFNDLSVTNANILTGTKTGYYTFTNNGISIEQGQTLQYDIPLTPELALGGGNYRIVLTWGENPRDLDSHLVTPVIEGRTYHVYYMNKGSMTSPPYAILDLDDTTSYGPETITINRTFSGTYNYYVHNYAGTGSLSSTSNAQVVVYSGSALIATYRVPTTGNGMYWQVFNLDGATGVITSINTIADAPQSSSSSASSLDLATYPEKPAEAPNRQFISPPGLGFSRERFTVKNASVNPILSWSWNFGDGTTAITQNPNHTYSNTGRYNVTLTIANLNGTNTETKVNYVTVTSQTPTTSTIGMYRNGVYYLRNTNTAGNADLAFAFGSTGDIPVTGDWNGDGIDTIGMYRNGVYYLRNTNTAGNADLAFAFGSTGDIPVTGDWNGDGIDTIGMYRNGVYYLRNTNTVGNADLAFAFGSPGDIPVTGDWNGDGIDTIGMYRNGVYYLRNTNTAGNADLAFAFGSTGDIPVTGDWNGDGIDTIGMYRNGVYYLRNTNTAGNADLAFAFGSTGDIPVTGKWV